MYSGCTDTSVEWDQLHLNFVSTYRMAMNMLLCSCITAVQSCENRSTPTCHMAMHTNRTLHCITYHGMLWKVCYGKLNYWHSLFDVVYDLLDKQSMNLWSTWNCTRKKERNKSWLWCNVASVVNFVLNSSGRITCRNYLGVIIVCYV